MCKLFIKIGETIILLGVAAFMLLAYVLLFLPEIPERARRRFSTKRKWIKQLKQERKVPYICNQLPVNGYCVHR